MSCLRDAARGAYERRWPVSSPCPFPRQPSESKRPRSITSAVAPSPGPRLRGDVNERDRPPVLLQDHRELRRGGGRGRVRPGRRRVLRAGAGEADPLRGPAGRDRAWRGRVLFHGVPRVPGGLRPRRQEPRWADHQAGGQSRPSRQRGRPLHPRAGLAPGALPPGPLPRPAPGRQAGRLG